MKWSIASVALLALCAAAASARAENSQPAGMSRDVNMNGAWSWEYAVTLRTPNGRPGMGVPTCDLVQKGNRINGECALNWVGKGPVTGIVAGDQVVLNWNFLFYDFALGRPEPGGLYNDKHADVTFRGSFDVNGIFHGRYRSDNQFGWNRVFFARQADGAPA